MTSLSRNQRMLIQCAPISDERVNDRSMRAAVHRARKTDEFSIQRNFDRAIAELVRAIPVPTEIADWAPSETLISPPRRGWKRYAKNPVILATGLAVAVIAGVSISHVVDRLNAFPGEDNARKLLTVAGSTRSLVLDPIKTDAGKLGDLFFMKYRLEHYDVPSEFAELKTLGCRVFPDEEAHRVAQIFVVEKRMQFFLFPAERDPKSGVVKHFSGWRYVDQDRWTGVVQEKNGVCFMAALRGREKDLAPYVVKAKE
jgi:hypothetical protein